MLRAYCIQQNPADSSRRPRNPGTKLDIRPERFPVRRKEGDPLTAEDIPVAPEFRVDQCRLMRGERLVGRRRDGLRVLNPESPVDCRIYMTDMRAVDFDDRIANRNGPPHDGGFLSGERSRDEQDHQHTFAPL